MLAELVCEVASGLCSLKMEPQHISKNCAFTKYNPVNYFPDKQSQGKQTLVALIPAICPGYLRSIWAFSDKWPQSFRVRTHQAADSARAHGS